jgi:hypothetical protein
VVGFTVGSRGKVRGKICEKTAMTTIIIIIIIIITTVNLITVIISPPVLGAVL